MSKPRRRANLGRIIFITGTDTGAGKTVLTGLLLAHLRHRRVQALAMKPFSAGDRADARLLRDLAGREMTLDEINSFHFRHPVTPLLAARMDGKSVRLADVLESIRENASKCEVLLVEGAGGLLAPLGKKFAFDELIRRVRGEVIIAAPNRLGVLNHTLLTLRALRGIALSEPRVALMGMPLPDASARTNLRVLRECCGSSMAVSIPYLAGDLRLANVVRIRAIAVARQLAGLLK